MHFVSDGQIITSKISATEKFQFGISLGLAKYYSDAISDNVRRGIEQKLRKGEWPGKAPFGYKNIVLENGKNDIAVDDYNAIVLKQVYELYATGTYSMQTLRKKFADQYGIKWSSGFIDMVLKNPFYYGVMLAKGKLYPHRYPPLITHALFDQVQKIKASFNKKPVKFAGRPYVYRGLFRCGECGLYITPEKHKGLVYYHCTQYHGKHGAKWFREETITKRLGEVFKRLQMPPEIVSEITSTLDEVQKTKTEFYDKHLNELKRKQKENNTMLDNLYLDKLKRRITEEQYDKFYTTLREEGEDIAIRLEQLQEADDNFRITAKYVLDLSNRAHDLFINSGFEEKRQLIKLVLSNLRMEGENIVYDVQKHFDVIIKNGDDMLWLGRKDSNLRMPGPKPGALPLGYAPKINFYKTAISESPNSLRTDSSICFRIFELSGWATSRNEPSFRRREGIDTNSPLWPSITFKSRIMKLSSKTIVA